MKCGDLFNSYSADQREKMAYRTWYPRTNLIKNHALPVIGDMELGNVSGSDIEEIYNAMREKGRKQNTIYGMYAALRSFFTYAVEINAITENPMDSVKPISQDLTI